MQRMTYQEIEQTYPNEWVLIDEPDLDQARKVRSGVVIAHSPKRNEVDAVSLAHRGHLAISYTGKIKGRVFVL